jgi:hypothetical protein
MRAAIEASTDEPRRRPELVSERTLLSLELGKHSQHVEEAFAGSSAGVDRLFGCLQDEERRRPTSRCRSFAKIMQVRMSSRSRADGTMARGKAVRFRYALYR